jgi:hypothetical protein
MEKPFSQACENNKKPILNILREYFAEVKTVLEVGSGTGQHAVYFAQHLPHLHWQTSDQSENLAGINAWYEQGCLSNLSKPLVLNVNDPWPISSIEAIFSANTLHIMSWLEVEAFFQGVAHVLQEKGICCVYGPFNYNGEYTSESNAHFDQWLQDRNGLSGIRNFEAVNRQAQRAELILLADHEMPANNRCLVWKKIGKK